MKNLEKIVDASIVKYPEPKLYNNSSMTVFFENANTLIEPFGRNVHKRDKQMRDFIFQEPYLMTTIYSLAATRAALTFTISGSPKTAASVQSMLLESNWTTLMGLISFDLATADNGAFMLTTRAKPQKGRNPWTAPVIHLSHLDSLRCFRTGNPLKPVIYWDIEGQYHTLNWWDVITLEDFPYPSKAALGIQVSFVSRVLKAAEIMASVATYKSEKVSGRFSKGIHLVGGVSQLEIEKIQQTGQLNADNAGLSRYMETMILATLDPNAKVSHEFIELASLYEGYSEDDVMKYYLSLLSSASGQDFLDLAPFSEGIGSSTMSETVHTKSRMKGLRSFTKLIEHKFKTHRVIPNNVDFTFEERDPTFELDVAKAAKFRAEARKVRIDSGEITAAIAQQIAVDAGDLKQEYLIAMGSVDITPSVTLSDDETVNPDMIRLEDDGIIETPTITPDDVEPDTEKTLKPLVAMRAVQHFRQIIDASKIQTVSPIPARQLDNFSTNLYNMLKTEIKLGTDDHWQDYILTKAASDAGIQPHMLRMRLPNDYQVAVTNTLVSDTMGVEVYKAKVTEKSVTYANCSVCNKNTLLHTFVPHKTAICQDHAYGFVSSATNLKQLHRDFRTQYLAIGQKFGYNSKQMIGMLTSAFAMAYSFKRHHLDDDDLKVIGSEVNRVKVLLQYTDEPDVFLTTLTKLYI